jgi:hypothetical protein
MADMTHPAKFYGAAFTPDREANLTKACRYLDMGCRAEETGEAHKVEMAMNAAIKAEREAFAA